MIESDPNFSTEQRRLCARDEELSICDGCEWAKLCKEVEVNGTTFCLCENCGEENNK